MNTSTSIICFVIGLLINIHLGKRSIQKNRLWQKPQRRTMENPN